MRKVLFTAITLMAFTGFSMAKTKEVKRVKKIKTTKVALIDPQTCLRVAVKQMMFYQECGASFEDSLSLTNSYYMQCIGEGSGSSSGWCSN